MYIKEINKKMNMTKETQSNYSHFPCTDEAVQLSSSHKRKIHLHGHSAS